MTGIPYTAAVDFDGTVCSYDFPRCGKPKDDVILVLRTLEQMNWRIIIYTSRTNAEWNSLDRRAKTAEMLDFLWMHHIPFHAVWCVGWGGTKVAWRDDPYAAVGSGWYWRDDIGKPVAHVYFEDRAVNPLLPKYRSPKKLLAACVELADESERNYREGMGVDEHRHARVAD